MVSKRTRKFIKHLKKKKIISDSPKPIIPFVITLAIFFLWIYLDGLGNIPPASLGFLFGLGIFSFIYAILHWIIVEIIRGKF